MTYHRPAAALDPVLPDALSNMGLAKNSDLAHALVSLGSRNLADVSWICVEDVLPSLCIPSLHDATATMELGFTCYCGVQFIVFYVIETRCTGLANYQKSESYTHEGFLASQDQCMKIFKPSQLIQRKPARV